MSDGAAPAPHSPALLTIDLGALCANYRLLRDKAGGAECAAVVKADAYGLGAARVGPALAGEGCRTFFVATLDEAEQLRGVEKTATVYVLDGLFPGTAEMFAALDARPVLSGIEECSEWAAFAKSRGRPLPGALHVDTGMNRLGLRPEDAARVARDAEMLKAIDLTLVMSHLSCADRPSDPKNETQREAFDAVRSLFPGVPASLANSGGVFLGSGYSYDMVRPGISLYGGRPNVDGRGVMTPVVRYEVRIAQVREAEAGETVGYGAEQRLERPTRIVTVAAGYADGFVRRLGGGAVSSLIARVAGHPAPILGRISMDLITLDATDIPGKHVRRGAMAELIGGHVTIDDLADKAGTISYEILTGLGRRAERRYEGP